VPAQAQPTRLGYDGRADDRIQHKTHITEVAMAKKSKNDNPVYKIVEVVGSSTTSWEDAARAAVESAAKTLRDLRVAEVTKLDMKIEDGKVVAYRARVSLSFKYEA
jgi:flavin-binding protein dodecin